MSLKNHNIYTGLKRIFHEPSRMAIISALCREETLTFNQLKEECELTFGNLSSHLKILKDAEIIKIHKEFVNNKPSTSVSITEAGKEQFLQYLKALEDVLKKAAEAVTSEKVKSNDSLFSINPDFQTS
jgi:DNA-binding MarR family transcriptional regulator